MARTPLKYVLITPARNEEAFIELTIKSVVQQTIRPLKWVIVSDGSTDRTDDIVKSYLPRCEWMELVRMPARRERHFGGKVACFNAGASRVTGVSYDLIGNLDGDLSFDSDLYEVLLRKFAENPRLGLAGAPFSEGTGTYDFRFSSIEHVSGACQLFRKKCFQDIGGYTPIKGGGIDVVAVLASRMKGWETRTFPERVCVHHRVMGTAKHSGLATGFKLGQKDYTLGRHPLWQLFRAIYQMTRRPIFIGGLMLFIGYFWSMIRRVERPVSKDLIVFQRAEQMARLRSFLFRSCSLGKSEPEKAGSNLSIRSQAKTN